MMRALLITLSLALAGCDGYEPGYGTVVEDPDAVGGWITETVRAANPMSDEEPEDNVLRVAIEARRLFGVQVVGVYRIDTGHRRDFIPYDDCTPGHKALVDAWVVETTTED